MQTFQIVVWFKDDKGEPKVESLYIGQSGVDAEKAYDDALVAGRKFDRALFISVFAGRPLPLIKADMRGTKPVFANSEPAELPKVNTDSTKELNAKEDTLRHERYEQAAKQEEERQSKLSKKEPALVAPTIAGEKPLITDGPTLEEWVASGYKPKDYPPEVTRKCPAMA